MTHDVDMRVATGVEGLDDVLCGGLPPRGMYLVQGEPGIGKTTLALQFLLEGLRRGEKSMYVALTESRDEVRDVARSHGWSIDGLEIYDAVLADESKTRTTDQTMFYPAEVELEETIKPLITELRRVRPCRVVVDSVSEIRLLAQDPLRFRRQLWQLKQFFIDQRATVLLIDPGAAETSILETTVAGILRLDKVTPLYGSTRRRIVIEKLRGVRFREGYHDYLIQTGGLVVHPRLIAAEHPKALSRQLMCSDVRELDAMLGGGLERGTSTLIMGAAGTGKSSLCTQYAMAAALRGEKSLIYTFEETVGTWMARTAALGFDIEPQVAAGRIRVIQVSPAEMLPGELSSAVWHAVEKENITLLIIDSLNGYLQSLPGNNFLLLHLHELLTYLTQQGVTTLMTIVQHGLIGSAMTAPVDVSYLADAVVLLRYFEAKGEVRQAVSVVKKRSGRHERMIREFRLDQGGVRVGDPLRQFHGVLTGVPTYRGDDAPLLRARDDE
jgi:circadian clock protein KaiC